MATNLCAECGTRLPRPEYKTHMQQVHGVPVMDDSDEDRSGAPQVEDATGVGAEGLADAAEGAAPARGGGRSGGARRGRRSARAEGEDGTEGAPPPVGEFACAVCDRSFASQQGLMRHTQAKHPDSAAVAAAEAPAGPPRRGGGRGRRTEGDGEAVAADGERRPPRQRRPRGAGRGTSGAAAVPDDPDEAAAVAAAAAAAALGGAPAASEPKPERLVTLFRCKLCEQGFKSKNRARSHVTETHPGDVPAEATPAAPVEPAAADGEAAPAEAEVVAADSLLELVQVTARRAPRSQARRGRRPAAAAAAEGDDAAAEGDGAAPRSTVRRGGRPPKTQAAADTGDAAVAPVADELAALGIVSAT